MTNSFNKTQPNCSQEIMIYSPDVAPLPRRLASCSNSYYWAKGTTVISGILNNATKEMFRLGHVDLNCSQINISSHNLWHASLKVSAAAATTTGHKPPFRKIIFLLRCSGSIVRPDKTYLVKSKLQLVYNYIIKYIN